MFWHTFWFTTYARLCYTVFDIRVFCKVRWCAGTAAGFECQGTTLRSARKTPWMKWSRDEVLSRISTAKSRATPIQTQKVSRYGQKWRRINSSKGSACLLIIWSLGISLQFMWLIKLGGIIEKPMRFMLAKVLRRKLIVCMAETKLA